MRVRVRVDVCVVGRMEMDGWDGWVVGWVDWWKDGVGG